jgi:hypothetical protein
MAVCVGKINVIFHKMTIHLASYFVYRRPFYFNNVPTNCRRTVAITQLFLRHSEFKKTPPAVVQTSFE